ncbi:MAG: hypothetical protein KI790_01595 [Cyclobacteriaceae bacterium]|nr:hypothetical protein [Cyclobacteriaceae bacterium HetDA_MAG_MS6]
MEDLDRIEQLSAAIDEIIRSSEVMVSWSLAVIGGSILTIISNSYNRPLNLYGRLIYLLFIPGWIYLGQSLFVFQELSGFGIGAKLQPSYENLKATVLQLNTLYASQSEKLLTGFIFFGAWLGIYLTFWITAKKFITEEQ